MFYILFIRLWDIWSRAGPNITKKGGPLQKMARGDRQTHLGLLTFGWNFDFSDLRSKLMHFLGGNMALDPSNPFLDPAV